MSESNPDFDVIVIAGAPGICKSTVSKLLWGAQGWPLIELGALRVFHLDRMWTRASAREEQMSFENLLALLANYKRYGYRNVLVNDLEEFRVREIPTVLAGYRYMIVSLIVDEDEHTRRVLDPTRDSGYRNVEAALAWNRAHRDRSLLPNEHCLNSIYQQPGATADAVLGILSRCSDA